MRIKIVIIETPESRYVFAESLAHINRLKDSVLAYAKQVHYRLDYSERMYGPMPSPETYADALFCFEEAKGCSVGEYERDVIDRPSPKERLRKAGWEIVNGDCHYLMPSGHINYLNWKIIYVMTFMPHRNTGNGNHTYEIDEITREELDIYSTSLTVQMADMVYSWN